MTWHVAPADQNDTGHLILIVLCIHLFSHCHDKLPKETEKVAEGESVAKAEDQEAHVSEENVKTDESWKGGSPVLLTVPASGAVVEETSKEPGNEPGLVGDHVLDESRMHVLGYDDNIRTKSLEQLPADQVCSLHFTIVHRKYQVEYSSRKRTGLLTCYGRLRTSVCCTFYSVLSTERRTPPTLRFTLTETLLPFKRVCSSSAIIFLTLHYATPLLPYKYFLVVIYQFLIWHYQE